jgi:hypothetical protein
VGLAKGMVEGEELAVNRFAWKCYIVVATGSVPPGVAGGSKIQIMGDGYD